MALGLFKGSTSTAAAQKKEAERLEAEAAKLEEEAKRLRELRNVML